MKNIKNIFILGVLLLATSCMNNFSEPDLSEPPFGNNEIGESNTLISELKKKYKDAIVNNGCKLITENVIIEGVVVADDRTGNIYKQLIINDKSGAIVLGVNDSGLYTYLPIGQRVRVNCKGLYVGGYGSLAQIGVETTHEKYGKQIGRLSRYDFRERVRLIGNLNMAQEELTPMLLDEKYLSNSENLNNTPVYAYLENVSFKEADGKRTFAPEAEQVSATNTAVERTVYVGSKKVVFRMSTYAKFAADILPQGKLNIKGVLTRYNNTWQFMLCSLDDIEIVE